jgi:hypothetical protein
MSIRLRQLQASLLLAALFFFLTGCKVSTHEEKGKQGKDVDIRTPLGSLSVHKGPVDPKETGLEAYPGAQVKTSEDDKDSSANVNISSSIFGMKLAVLKYQTSDSPDKVLDFYRKEMSRYGKVLVCTGGFNMSFHHHDTDSEVTCDDRGGTNHDYKQELKVGTENNQRIVAVKPSGNGTEFVMLYVRARDEKDTM